MKLHWKLLDARSADEFYFTDYLTTCEIYLGRFVRLLVVTDVTNL